jgi:hypothetical protein
VSLESPLFLLLFLAAPLAWLFGRLRARRIPVEVPSLVFWDRVAEAPGAPETAERRRPIDLRVAVETLVFALLAVAAAGPRIGAGGAAKPRVAIVFDSTPSMLAAGRVDARTRALRDLEGRLGAVETVSAETPLLARLAGADAVYFFTDHDPGRLWEGDPPLFPVIVGGGGANAGIVSAGGRIGPDGALEIAARVSPEGTVTPVRVAPAPAGPVEVRRVGPPDALAADDEAVLYPPGAPPRVSVHEGLSFVRRALAAAGAEIDDRPAPPDIAVLCGADPGRGPRIVIASVPGEGAPPEDLIAIPNPLVRFCDPADQRLRVAPAEPPPDLRPIVVDRQGRTVIGMREGREGTLVWIGIPLAMGDRATDWASRRSFPAFFAEILSALAPRRAEGDVWRAKGVLSEAETREAQYVEPSPLPPALVPLGRGSRSAPGFDLSPGGAGAAGALMLLAFGLARERRIGR